MQNRTYCVLTMCMLLCLALNYTFPLHRGNSKRSPMYANDSWHWDDLVHHKSIVERSKKMANDIENVIKKIRTSAQDIGKNIYENGLKRENKFSDRDLRQYEQLVIMKKYPYLDLKELEYRFSPIYSKNTRQSIRIEPESNFRSDSNMCEPEDGINVEIINRGLSGFSIPHKIVKGVGVMEDKVKTKNIRQNPDSDLDTETKKSSKRRNLDRLQNDIVQYKIRKNIVPSV